jgi:CTP synthase
MSKYVFVFGSLSSIGKGIVAASTVLLLKARSHKVDYLKLDAYRNISASLLAPGQHGELVILDDGHEVDLDLGSIEKICSLTLNKDNIYTSGTIFKELIEEQERGDYLGQTITDNPFVINKVIQRLEKLGENKDVVVCETGGSVDDHEASIFIDAIRKFKLRNECVIVHVAHILWLKTVEEFKTKPLQRSIRDLQSHGLSPDILICRCEKEIPNRILNKIADLTGMLIEDILVGIDCETIYSVPINLYNQNYDDIVVDKLRLKRSPCRIHKYKEIVEKLTNPNLATVTIGIVCKYRNVIEAYLSIKEALTHASVPNNVKVLVKWIQAEELEKVQDVAPFFEGVHGVIIGPGFGERGILGKIKAAQYLRENNTPTLGICLGLQVMTIEFARNVLGLKDANSLEFDKHTSNSVIHYIEGQENIQKKSGTLRLGSYDCQLIGESLAARLYDAEIIKERHRHRCEVNPAYIDQYEKEGFVVSGTNPQSGLVEIMEHKNLSFYVGAQFHPEYKSQVTKAAPFFQGLIAAAVKYRNKMPEKIENEFKTISISTEMAKIILNDIKSEPIRTLIEVAFPTLATSM